MRIGENQENSIPLTLAPNDHMKFNTNFSDFTKKPNASGTSWAKTMNSYMKLMDEFNLKQQAIAAKQNTLSEAELTSEFNTAKEVIDQFARKKMLQYPTSPYNIILSMSLVPSTGFDYWNPENLVVFQKVASAFQEKYGDTPTCNSFISQYAQIEAGYQQYQNIQNGTITAPNFTLTTPDGKSISLADFKGKVVLIDFWASWCGPCRKESPNLVRLYQTYKGKDFVILSVSLDDKKDAWLNAIEKDGLIWTTHGSDLKGWETPLTSLYGFESIPHTVLVNQNGMIVGKGLRGELLINKIKTLF
jgi:thiol-disulfide isomerase/thioredoxin